MSATHLVILKDKTEYRVSESQAANVARAVEARRSFYLKDDYLSWTQIESIRRISGSDLRLTAPPTCGRCENGWLFSKNGAYPCSCNRTGKEAMLEYRHYLDSNAPH
jgi:hypothetical protein